MQKYFNNVVNRTGDVVVGALVTVTNTATGALASLFVDDGVTPSPNPVVTDNNGFFEFYVDFGRYSLTISGGGVNTLTIPDISLEDSSIEAADAAASAAAAAASAAAAAASVSGFAAPTGANLVGFLQGGTGAVATTVQTKLREFVSVKDFGATGDGVTTETTLVQAAIDAVATAGGGIVYFPPGTYRVRNLQAKDRVKCVGVFGATTLKVPDGVDGQIFFNPDQASSTTVDYFGLDGLIFDGNKAADAGVTASSAVAINGVTYFYAKDCIFQNATGYGLGLQSFPGSSLPGVQTNVYLENCYFLNNGDGVGGDTFDGLDIKDCDILTMVGCVASGNTDRGINIRGEKVTILGGYSANNGTSGYEIAGNANNEPLATTLKLIGCEARSNAGAGFSVANGAGGATQPVRLSYASITSVGNALGVEIQSGSSLVEITISDAHIFSNTSHGVAVNSTPRACIIRGSVIRGNTGSGVYTNAEKVQISDCQINSNTRYGVEEGVSATRTVVAGATYVQSNTLGQFLFNANGRHAIGRGVIDYDMGSGDIIASATTITLPQGGDFFAVTGTTTITTITASRRGRVATLQFTGALTVDEGPGNLILASDFVTTSSDTLTLVCDGTNWIEVARSVN